MTIRFGVSPIAWINDDMPELGGDTPVERVFQDIEELGFSGVELGGKFPRDPNVLRALLCSHRSRKTVEGCEHERLGRFPPHGSDGVVEAYACFDAIGSADPLVSEPSNDAVAFGLRPSLNVSSLSIEAVTLAHLTLRGDPGVRRDLHGRESYQFC